ncbi:MAG: hypothetical protein N2234_00690 [Planctomycetota bacterium]|nr:hypothetical protein [Planctomycetota bacterium]
MECERVRKLIPLVSGGDGEIEETSLVERHISVCSSCNTLYQQYLSDREALKTLSSPSIPPSVEEKLKNLVETSLIQQRKKRAPLTVRIIRKITGVALIVVAILAFLFYMGREEPLQEEKPPEGVVERVEYKRMMNRAVENASIEENEKTTPAKREKCRLLDSADTSHFDF